MAVGALMLMAICLSSLTAIISKRNIALEVERNRADEASRLKSQFLSNISHEIRPPLNGIIGTLQFIADDSLSRGDRETIDIVKRSSRSLLEIVRGILDLM